MNKLKEIVVKNQQNLIIEALTTNDANKIDFFIRNIDNADFLLHNFELKSSQEYSVDIGNHYAENYVTKIKNYYYNLLELISENSEYFYILDKALNNPKVRKNLIENTNFDDKMSFKDFVNLKEPDVLKWIEKQLYKDEFEHLIIKPEVKKTKKIKNN